MEGPALNRISRWYIHGEKDAAEEAAQLIDLGGEQTAMYQNFISAVKRQDTLLVDGYEGKKAIETIFGIYQSVLQKQPVQLPLSSFQTSDMKNK